MDRPDSKSWREVWEGTENGLPIDPPQQAISALKILFGIIAYMQARAALRGRLHQRTVDQLARPPGPVEKVEWCG